ncbi:SNF2 family N-terminal domain-containing protein [Whalleya microplaca]|nr:SNF2 family N-terminal domain-containing protein [Whalleya microplaca]
MGRSDRARAAKTGAYSQKGSAEVERSRRTDPLPKDFLAFMQAHQQPDADGTTGGTEPPRKRTRTERVEEVDSIPVSRHTLTVSRPVQGFFTNPRPMLCAHVDRYARLRYDNTSQILAISSIRQSSYSAFTSELELDHPSPSLTHSMLTVLDVMAHSRDDKSKEGALWVNVSVNFERKGNQDHLLFSFELNWNSATNILRSRSQRGLSLQVLHTFFRSSQSQVQGGSTERLLPQAFYDAAFVPSRDHTDIPLSPTGLTSELYPFQRRALQWLLKREGVRWNNERSDGTSGLEPLSLPSSSDLPLSFRVVKDADGQSVYISDLYHVVTRDLTALRRSEAAVKGGILAEEMGLGKTVETISLILMHPRPLEPPTVFDEFTAQNVHPTGATLIVTPTTLEAQWLADINKHAPNLRVMMYKGLKKSPEADDELVAQLIDHDIVITTYSVLQTEIHHAEAPPRRSMRYESKYQRMTSPLVQISWWRVCLDEAQQIESGVSSAAKVARLIPRINAWGITGTPVNKDIKDLWGLLSFLRYEPFASSPALWDALTTSHKDLFKPLFRSISLRHTKHAIRDELTLPSQKRYVISMSLTGVEEQHYGSQFRSLARGLGLTEYGAPLRGEIWDPEDLITLDSMKRALAQLRQTVLHPDLGPGPLRALAQKNRPLRTIDEVLDVMIKHSEWATRDHQISLLFCKLKRGQAFEAGKKVEDAVRVWQEVTDEVQPLEAECRAQLEIALENARNAGIDDDIDAQDIEPQAMTNVVHDSDMQAIRDQLLDSRRRVRAILDIRHRAAFFIASGFFQRKDGANPNSEEYQKFDEAENDGYEAAKRLRREILHESLSKASSRMNKIESDAASQSLVKIPEIKLPRNLHLGLETQRVVDNLHTLSDALNEQANLIYGWRDHVVHIILQPLVDTEASHDIKGDEYETSVGHQDELMVYTLVLRAAIADRHVSLTGLENTMIIDDIRSAERRAKEGIGHCPEKLISLLKQRQVAKLSSLSTTFHGILAELRELENKCRHETSNGSRRAEDELSSVDLQRQLARNQLTIQKKVVTALTQELNRFTAAMNARVEYYKSLQNISHTVVPLSEHFGLYYIQTLTASFLEEEQRERRELTAAKSTHRYLLHLRDAGQDSDGLCTICQNDFTLGVLTECGHQFCKDCLMSWMKINRTCPVCKNFLSPAMIHNVALKKHQLKLRQEPSHPGSEILTKSRKLGIYSQFSDEKLEAIRGVELNGPSYGTKIDTLVKHILWLREEDPGAKSVIFSQFKGFLNVLSQAFTRYGIGYASFDKPNGIPRFKEDPRIGCFFMDARAHASGLNLVNASHVFLCEPLLNTALELQAIARVDRIGQKRQTTVWLYLIDGTVEESIYNLSIQRRMEHLGETDAKGKSKETALEGLDASLEVANSMELQRAALPKLMNTQQDLGEVVDKGDLWTCLFGHVRNEASPDVPDDTVENPAVMGSLAVRMQDQAEAGPSA